MYKLYIIGQLSGAVGVSQGQGCDKSSDCSDSQCCVLPLVGRRRLLALGMGGGMCSPMPQLEEGKNVTFELH